ncbi:hypothetical protein Tco_1425249 [Tanacetum coccineum]
MFSSSTVTYTSVYINSEPWRFHPITDYIDDSDPKEDREDPEEDPADYPANGGDNDDNESSDDDENDDNMIMSPQAEDAKAVKTDESAPTPSTPYHLFAATLPSSSLPPSVSPTPENIKSLKDNIKTSI